MLPHSLFFQVLEANFAIVIFFNCLLKNLRSDLGMCIFYLVIYEDHMNSLFILLKQDLTVTQIKRIRQIIDDQMKDNDRLLLETEDSRNESLREIGNMLHESCIISNNEVRSLGRFSLVSKYFSI